ncbi:MAG: hypothetical protein AAFX86_11810 [Pseudomonadota bacterium]
MHSHARLFFGIDRVGALAELSCGNVDELSEAIANAAFSDGLGRLWRWPATSGQDATGK